MQTLILLNIDCAKQNFMTVVYAYSLFTANRIQISETTFLTLKSCDSFIITPRGKVAIKVSTNPKGLWRFYSSTKALHGRV